jgi:hypothetical protein
MSSAQRRRRNKGGSPGSSLSSLATKAFAAYGAYKAASWAWGKIYSKDEDEPSSQSGSESTRNTANTTSRRVQFQSNKSFFRKRASHLERCSRETLSMLGTFLNTLQSTIERHTDFTKEMKMLKQLRNGQVADAVDGEATPTKQELWDRIKTKSITRMIVTVYAHSILILLLTVQINLLGGRIFREQISEHNAVGSEEESSSRNETQSGENSVEGGEDSSSHKQVLLQSLDYFFQHGIKKLVESVQLAVETSVSHWKVVPDDNDDDEGNSMRTCSLTLDQFEGGMQQIRNILDEGLLLEKYIDRLEADSDSCESEEARQILYESLDILESPVFETAKKDVVNVTFDVLRNHGYAPLFDDSGEGDTHLLSPPLATIVTKLKKITKGFYHSSSDDSEQDYWTGRPMSSYPSVYLYYLYRINSMKELGDVSFN